MADHKKTYFEGGCRRPWFWGENEKIFRPVGVDPYLRFHASRFGGHRYDQCRYDLSNHLGFRRGQRVGFHHHTQDHRRHPLEGRFEPVPRITGEWTGWTFH